MRSIRGLSRGIVVVASLLLITVSVRAGSVDLGSAANYVVVGMGGISSAHADFEIYQSATVVNGNVAVGPYSNWTHGVDATINGRVDNDTTNSPPIVTGTITGGVHSVPTSGIVTDARNASTTAAGLTPTQIYSTLTENQVIVGNGGLNVIRVTGDVTLKKGLTLQGSSSDEFVFQLTASDAPSAATLTLSGMVMNLSAGVNIGNIYWDLNGLGGGVSISSGAIVYGSFLAPDRGFLVDNATVTGRVIGGGGYQDSHSNSLSIHSSSTINSPPPGAPGVPLPSAACAGIALMGVMGLSRRRQRARPYSAATCA
jgi:hypothetical protein